MHSFSIKGNFVNAFLEKTYPAELTIRNGKIDAIQELTSIDGEEQLPFILPGFVDSHVHIESSMLVPSEFAKLAVVHGTVATVSDPHEIANVCGIAGVEFMIENGNSVPFKFNFGAPSCVPATSFETAGAVLDAKDVNELMARKEIKYLSEVMNFPAVLMKDEEMMKKIDAAIQNGKPIDGHAPGLRGEKAKQYIEANHSGNRVVISTDHECFTAEEALDKLKHGMKIIIREGSAAKNFEALIDLLNNYPTSILFCSDDKHPDSLVVGHINQLCARAVAKGIDIYKIIKAACINPVQHYKLDVGLLNIGDDADFIVAKDLINFEIVKTYINGELVAANGKSLIKSQPVSNINNFLCSKKTIDDFELAEKNISSSWPIIEALDGQLITNKFFRPNINASAPQVADPANDILKIVVVNRYKNAATAMALIKNFDLKRGAIASSVAHDSHNIVAVGVDNESICKAVNIVIQHKGGISLVDDNLELSVPLPIAGLMSTDDGYKVAEQYALIDNAAKKMGSSLASPFMTLSFMALLVIPHVKLSDLGLFDGDTFRLID